MRFGRTSYAVLAQKTVGEIARAFLRCTFDSSTGFDASCCVATGFSVGVCPLSLLMSCERRLFACTAAGAKPELVRPITL